MGAEGQCQPSVRSFTGGVGTRSRADEAVTGLSCSPRCLVPAFDSAFCSREWQEALLHLRQCPIVPGLCRLLDGGFGMIDIRTALRRIVFHASELRRRKSSIYREDGSKHQGGEPEWISETSGRSCNVKKMSATRRASPTSIQSARELALRVRIVRHSVGCCCQPKGKAMCCRLSWLAQRPADTTET